MRFAPFITAVMAVILVAGTAFASNVPDPTRSTFDNFLGRSPHNVGVGAADLYSYSYHGTLLNAASQPIVGFPRGQVHLSIEGVCQNHGVFSPDSDSAGDGSIVWGVATSDAMGGGSCLGSAPTAPVVVISIDNIGVFKTLLSVTSPDEDGLGGGATLTDFVTFKNAYNANGPLYLADMNGSGAISLQDFTVFQHHFNTIP